MTATYACPRGDQSEDPEFCSVCGTRIQPDVHAASAERCPSCGMERNPDARYCETCRYDFRTAQASAVDPVAPGPVIATPVIARYWEAVVSIDPALDVEPDPATPCPTDTPERAFPLDLPENLIGRRSAPRGILPAIALNDPGVSHRHVMVYRNPDATLMVSDLGSTNGTFLDGSADRLEPGVKTVVADGDRIELGRWTRVAFRSRES